MMLGALNFTRRRPQHRSQKGKELSSLTCTQPARFYSVTDSPPRETNDIAPIQSSRGYSKTTEAVWKSRFAVVVDKRPQACFSALFSTCVPC